MIRAAMLRTVVNSTTFRSIGYDPDQSLLELEFLNDRAYQYTHVPREVYEEMRAAPSLGRFYLDHIKDRFDEIPLR
jgi:hypothetical protein